MFSQNSKINYRSVSIPLAVVLIALVAGIYFAFKAFPAGPGKEVSANAPAGTVFERKSPLNYSGNWIPSSSPFAAAVVAKHSIVAYNKFETGAPLHYSGKVIAPGARCVSSSTPQHYIDAGYALRKCLSPSFSNGQFNHTK